MPSAAPTSSRPTAAPFVIAREDQLRALMDVRYGVHLLTQFSEQGGLSASDVARKLGEPAPRVSYYVRRLEQAGLLVATAEQHPGRSRRLVPVARRFAVTPELHGLLNMETVRPFLQELVEAFLGSSTGRNSLAWQDEAGGPLVVVDLDQQQLPGGLPSGAPRAMLHTRRLTPEAFERAAQAAWQAMQSEPEAPPGTPGARYFTLSLLGFPGSMLPLAENPDDPKENA